MNHEALRYNQYSMCFAAPFKTHFAQEMATDGPPGCRRSTASRSDDAAEVLLDAHEEFTCAA